MPVTNPQDLDRAYAEAFNAHNLDALLALYEEHAIHVGPLSHEPVKGKAAIRDALEHSLRVRGSMTLETTYCYQSDDIALLRSKWRVAGKAPDGRPVEIAGISSDVARRQKDGSWLFVIDHPLGADPKEHSR
jgi:ketosteroid isomerase-like protein